MEKILIGTVSQSKINIIKSFFERGHEKFCFVSLDVLSGISEQPLSEEETIVGSINRAKNAIKKYNKDFVFSLGLEAGLVKMNDIHHLVCAVSIIDEERNIFTGVSKRLPLPFSVSSEIDKKKEFGVTIRKFSGSPNGRSSKEVFNLVKELIDRKKTFKEALSIAYFKYNYKFLFLKK